MAYRVLIVEDQLMPRRLFENIVNSSAHYEVAAAIDSAELADLYCAGQPIDLILMDVVMKDGINGLDAAVRIHTAYPDIRIIIVTSMPDALILERAREIGIDSLWYKELEELPLPELMDRTMAGEHIFPDTAPSARIGMASSSDFTARELDVLRMLVAGYSDKEIATMLEMSFHTVRFHMNNLLGKTGCTSRTTLALQAARAGIVIPGI